MCCTAQPFIQFRHSYNLLTIISLPQQETVTATFHAVAAPVIAFEASAEICSAEPPWASILALIRALIRRAAAMSTKCRIDGRQPDGEAQTRIFNQPQLKAVADEMSQPIRYAIGLYIASALPGPLQLLCARDHIRAGV